METVTMKELSREVNSMDVADKKPTNIYQRMQAVQSTLKTVAKNLNVDISKAISYKAVSEVDVLNAIKPLEEKYGIYSYPCNREIVESSQLTQHTQYGDKTSFFMRILTTYRFVNVDDPSEYIETITFADGIDSGDKTTGKAMTYADKYALMKAYKISTGDDPDQEASKEYREKPSGRELINQSKNEYVELREELKKRNIDCYEQGVIDLLLKLGIKDQTLSDNAQHNINICNAYKELIRMYDNKHKGDTNG